MSGPMSEKEMEEEFCSLPKSFCSLSNEMTKMPLRELIHTSFKFEKWKMNSIWFINLWLDIHRVVYKDDKYITME